MHTLRKLEVPETDIVVSLRVFEDLLSNIIVIKTYWASILGVAPTTIHSVNVVTGKKSGKLPYGMCRVRVRSGKNVFKLVMSMIEILKRPHSSTDRATDS